MPTPALHNLTGYTFSPAAKKELGVCSVFPFYATRKTDFVGNNAYPRWSGVPVWRYGVYGTALTNPNNFEVASTSHWISTRPYTGRPFCYFFQIKGDSGSFGEQAFFGSTMTTVEKGLYLAFVPTSSRLVAQVYYGVSAQYIYNIGVSSVVDHNVWNNICLTAHARSGTMTLYLWLNGRIIGSNAQQNTPLAEGTASTRATLLNRCNYSSVLLTFGGSISLAGFSQSAPSDSFLTRLTTNPQGVLFQKARRTVGLSGASGATKPWLYRRASSVSRPYLQVA